MLGVQSKVKVKEIKDNLTTLFIQQKYIIKSMSASAIARMTSSSSYRHTPKHPPAME